MPAGQGALQSSAPQTPTALPQADGAERNGVGGLGKHIQNGLAPSSVTSWEENNSRNDVGRFQPRGVGADPVAPQQLGVGEGIRCPHGVYRASKYLESNRISSNSLEANFF